MKHTVYKGKEDILPLGGKEKKNMNSFNTVQTMPVLEIATSS